MESTCNCGGKLVDTCSTKNPGVGYSTWNSSCGLFVLIYTWKSNEVCTFFKCNPCCISHVDYWCIFSGVFHMNCYTWINGVGIFVHVDIRWISCEGCHLILFHMFSTFIFHMDYWCTYPHVYLVDIK